MEVKAPYLLYLFIINPFNVITTVIIKHVIQHISRLKYNYRFSSSRNNLSKSILENAKNYFNYYYYFRTNLLCAVYGKQGGRGQLAANYTSPQSFIVMFSHSLA